MYMQQVQLCPKLLHQHKKKILIEGRGLKMEFEGREETDV